LRSQLGLHVSGLDVGSNGVNACYVAMSAMSWTCWLQAVASGPDTVPSNFAHSISSVTRPVIWSRAESVPLQECRHPATDGHVSQIDGCGSPSPGHATELDGRVTVRSAWAYRAQNHDQELIGEPLERVDTWYETCANVDGVQMWLMTGCTSTSKRISFIAI
jgi:hypothetical protein